MIDFSIILLCKLSFISVSHTLNIDRSKNSIAAVSGGLHLYWGFYRTLEIVQSKTFYCIYFGIVAFISGFDMPPPTSAAAEQE